MRLNFVLNFNNCIHVSYTLYTLYIIHTYYDNADKILFMSYKYFNFILFLIVLRDIFFFMCYNGIWIFHLLVFCSEAMENFKSNRWYFIILLLNADEMFV